MGKLKASLAFTKFLVLLFAFNYFTTGIHEWIHLSVLKYFGGNGYIVRTWLGGGATVFTKNSSNPFIVALSGGVFVGLLFLAIALLDWSTFDSEGFAGVLPIALSQISYGVFEAFFMYSMPRGEYMAWAGLANAIGLFIGLPISLWVLAVSLMQKWSSKP